MAASTMKQIILLLVLSSEVFSEDLSFKQILGELLPLGSVQVRTLYFQQELDHFNPENNQKWNQRYWVSATYYKKSGPAFLFIHGEEVIKSIESSFPSSWLAYAKEVNAICFSLDHRFYGESWPANASIEYLSTRQSLADIKNFIQTITKEFKFKHISWIVFGCSYAGTLATWARLEYPNLILGAVASGAPLLATAIYPQYLEIVEQTLKAYNPKCLESISSAFEEIACYIEMNKEIKVERNFSSNTFFEYMASWRINRPEYMAPRKVLLEMISTIACVSKANEIPTVCDTMMNYEGSKVQAFFELDKKIMICQGDLTMAIKNHVDNPKPNTMAGWNYQQCSEFGFFLVFNTTTFFSSVTHLFGQIEHDVISVCYPFYGSNFSLKTMYENVNRTNMRYGGLNININNIVFIHGSLDPWHPLGLYEKRNDSLYETIFIKGTAHCDDVKKPTDKDIPDLRKARNKILELLKSWLKNNK